MIVGDRNAGKRMATLAVVLLIMIFVITLLVGTRKRTDPAKQPPLHPSLVVVGACE
jgi:hypothetical protein